MKENKLGTYLTSFTEKDWVIYPKYCRSQFLYDSDYQLVINYIKKHKSRYDPSTMDSEYLRKKIRPSAKKQVFANVISGLCKHIEQYLIWVEVENDPMMKDTLLLQALGKRGLTTQFYKQKEKAKVKREAAPIGLWNNYHDFMAEYLLYFNNITSDIKISKIALEKANLNIKQFSNTINGYLEVEIHNRIVLTNEDWSPHLGKSSMSIPQKNEIKKVFEYLIKLKQHNEKKHYYSLKKILEKSELSLELSYTIIIHLSSFLNRIIVRGEKSYGSELLQLYQYGISKNILFPNGKIPLVRYLNIILLACGVKEFDWALNFVVKNSKLVGTELEDSAKRLGKAHIKFYLNDFENVILLLRNTRYKDFEFEIRAKWLILSSHYELNKQKFEAVEYFINSFKYFVKRNKDKTTSLGARAFLKCANFLLKISKSSKPQDILEEIKKESHLFYRGWLIKKTEEKII